MVFDESSFLQLSGLQHFKYCRRQWALIHIENQWVENYKTVDGEIMHDRAHDSGIREKRGDTITVRNMRIASSALGVSGACDVVEFRRSQDGISLAGEEGLYSVYPVEYKRGSPRTDSANELQLCGQAMCLEEMLCCDIPKGALFFGEIRRRIEVEFTTELRNSVRDSLMEMHELFKRGYTPKVKPTKGCNSCSLQEICLPRLSKALPVKVYIRKSLEE